MSLFAQYILPITVLAGVGSGLMAGLLFAFSNFVVKALTRLPPEQGMAAMQLINVTIINPVFLLLFLGTAVLCAVLALYSVLQWQSTTTVWLPVGCVFYLVGTVGVTMAFNVPRSTTYLPGPKLLSPLRRMCSLRMSKLGWENRNMEDCRKRLPELRTGRGPRGSDVMSRSKCCQGAG